MSEYTWIDKLDFKPNSNLGQNFLIDTICLENYKIVKTLADQYLKFQVQDHYQ